MERFKEPFNLIAHSISICTSLGNVLTCSVLFCSSEDKGALGKLVEAIKTNYNDRYEEVKNHFYTYIPSVATMNLKRDFWLLQ